MYFKGYQLESDTFYSGPDNSLNDGAMDTQSDAFTCSLFCKSKGGLFFSWTSEGHPDENKRGHCWCKSSEEGRQNLDHHISGKAVGESRRMEVYQIGPLIRLFPPPPSDMASFYMARLNMDKDTIEGCWFEKKQKCLGRYNFTWEDGSKFDQGFKVISCKFHAS